MALHVSNSAKDLWDKITFEEDPVVPPTPDNYVSLNPEDEAMYGSDANTKDIQDIQLVYSHQSKVYDDYLKEHPDETIYQATKHLMRDKAVISNTYRKKVNIMLDSATKAKLAQRALNEKQTRIDPDVFDGSVVWSADGDSGIFESNVEFDSARFRVQGQYRRAGFDAPDLYSTNVGYKKWDRQREMAKYVHGINLDNPEIEKKYHDYAWIETFRKTKDPDYQFQDFDINQEYDPKHVLVEDEKGTRYVDISKEKLPVKYRVLGTDLNGRKIIDILVPDKDGYLHSIPDLLAANPLTNTQFDIFNYVYSHKANIKDNIDTTPLGELASNEWWKNFALPDLTGEREDYKPGQGFSDFIDQFTASVEKASATSRANNREVGSKAQRVLDARINSNYYDIKNGVPLQTIRDRDRFNEQAMTFYKAAAYYHKQYEQTHNEKDKDMGEYYEVLGKTSIARNIVSNLAQSMPQSGGSMLINWITGLAAAGIASLLGVSSGGAAIPLISAATGVAASTGFGSWMQTMDDIQQYRTKYGENPNEAQKASMQAVNIATYFWEAATERLDLELLPGGNLYKALAGVKGFKVNPGLTRFQDLKEMPFLSTLTAPVKDATGKVIGETPLAELFFKEAESKAAQFLSKEVGLSKLEAAILYPSITAISNEYQEYIQEPVQTRGTQLNLSGGNIWDLVKFNNEAWKLSDEEYAELMLARDAAMSAGLTMGAMFAAPAAVKLSFTNIQKLKKAFNNLSIITNMNQPTPEVQQALDELSSYEIVDTDDRATVENKVNGIAGIIKQLRKDTVNSKKIYDIIRECYNQVHKTLGEQEAKQVLAELTNILSENDNELLKRGIFSEALFRETNRLNGDTTENAEGISDQELELFGNYLNLSDKQIEELKQTKKDAENIIEDIKNAVRKGTISTSEAAQTAYNETVEEYINDYNKYVATLEATNGKGPDADRAGNKLYRMAKVAVERMKAFERALKDISNGNRKSSAMYNGLAGFGKIVYATVSDLYDSFVRAAQFPENSQERTDARNEKGVTKVIHENISHTRNMLEAAKKFNLITEEEYNEGMKACNELEQAVIKACEQANIIMTTTASQETELNNLPIDTEENTDQTLTQPQPTKTKEELEQETTELLTELNKAKQEEKSAKKITERYSKSISRAKKANKATQDQLKKEAELQTKAKQATLKRERLEKQYFNSKYKTLNPSLAKKLAKLINKLSIALTECGEESLVENLHFKTQEKLKALKLLYEFVAFMTTNILAIEDIDKFVEENFANNQNILNFYKNKLRKEIILTYASINKSSQQKLEMMLVSFFSPDEQYEGSSAYNTLITTIKRVKQILSNNGLLDGTKTFNDLDEQTKEELKNLAKAFASLYHQQILTVNNLLKLMSDLVKNRNKNNTNGLGINLDSYLADYQNLLNEANTIIDSMKTLGILSEDITVINLDESTTTDSHDTSSTNPVNMFIQSHWGSNIRNRFIQTLKLFFSLNNKSDEEILSITKLVKLNEELIGLKSQALKSTLFTNIINIEDISDIQVKKLVEKTAKLLEQLYPNNTKEEWEAFFKKYKKNLDFNGLFFLFNNFDITMDSSGTQRYKLTLTEKIAVPIVLAIFNLLGSNEFENLFKPNEAANGAILSTFISGDTKLLEDDGVLVGTLKNILLNYGIPYSYLTNTLGTLILRHLGADVNNEEGTKDTNSNLAQGIGTIVLRLLTEHSFNFLDGTSSEGPVLIVKSDSEASTIINSLKADRKNLTINNENTFVRLSDFAVLDVVKTLGTNQTEYSNHVFELYNKMQNDDFYAVLDFETAMIKDDKDVSPNKAAIAQIAVKLYNKKGELVEEHSVFVDFDDTTYALPETVGVGTENPIADLYKNAKDNGQTVSQEEAILLLQDYITHNGKLASFLVGHNSRKFDVQVIYETVNRLTTNIKEKINTGVQISNDERDLYQKLDKVKKLFESYDTSPSDTKHVDTLTLAKQLLPGNEGGHSLGTLAVKFGFNMQQGQAHDARFDVDQTNYVFTMLRHLSDTTTTEEQKRAILEPYFDISRVYEYNVLGRIRQDYMTLKDLYFKNEKDRDLTVNFPDPSKIDKLTNPDILVHNTMGLLRLSERMQKDLDEKYKVPYTLTDYKMFEWLLNPNVEERMKQETAYKIKRGWKFIPSRKSGELYDHEFQQQVNLNKQIENELEGYKKIMEAWDKAGRRSNFTFHIPRFFAKHGRQYMKGAIINPQNFKDTQRYFIVAQSQIKNTKKISFDTLLQDSKFAYFILTLFNVKKDIPTLIEELKKDPQYQTKETKLYVSLVNYLLALDTENIDNLKQYYLFGDTEKTEELFNQLPPEIVKYLKNTENNGQALALIAFLKKRDDVINKANGIYEIETCLPCEIDSVTSGTFLKCLQFAAKTLISGDEKTGKKGLGAALGIITNEIKNNKAYKNLPETAHGVKALLGRLNEEELPTDAYLVTALEYRSRITEEVQDSNGNTITQIDDTKLTEIITDFLNDEDFIYKQISDNLKAFIRNTTGKDSSDKEIREKIIADTKLYLKAIGLANLGTDESRLKQALRNLFKDPTMVYGYGAGFSSITRSLATIEIEEFLSVFKGYMLASDKAQYVSTLSNKQKDQLAFIQHIADTYFYGIEDLHENLKKQHYNTIISKDGSTTLFDIFKYYTASSTSYGAYTILEEKYSDFAEFNKLMEYSAGYAFKVFNNAYNKKLEELHKRYRGVVPLKEYKKALEDLKALYPSIVSVIDNHASTIFFGEVEYGMDITDENIRTQFIGTNSEGKPIFAAVHPNTSKFIGPGKSGSVLGIHNLDSFIAMYVTNYYKYLTCIFDAFIVDSNDINKVSNKYNEAAFLLNMVYSLPHAFEEMLLRSFDLLYEQEVTNKVGNSKEHWMNTTFLKSPYGTVVTKNGNKVTLQEYKDFIYKKLEDLKQNKNELFGHFDSNGTFILGSIVRIQNMDGSDNTAGINVIQLLERIGIKRIQTSQTDENGNIIVYEFTHNNSTITNENQLRRAIYKLFEGRHWDDLSNKEMETSPTITERLNKYKDALLVQLKSWKQGSSQQQQNSSNTVGSEYREFWQSDANTVTETYLKLNADVNARIDFLRTLLLKEKGVLSKEDEKYLQDIGKLWRMSDPNSLLNVTVKVSDDGIINAGTYDPDGNIIHIHTHNTKFLQSNPFGWSPSELGVYKRKSAAEVYAHEAMHGQTLFALWYGPNEDFKKAFGLWRLAQKHLKNKYNKEGWKVFLPYNYSNLDKKAQEAAEDYAKNTYNYLFTINNDMDKFDLGRKISEFMLYTITNPQFKAEMIEAKDKNSNSLFEKIFGTLIELFRVVFKGKRFSVAFTTASNVISGERGLLTKDNVFEDVQNLYIKLSRVNRNNYQNFHNSNNLFRVIDGIISTITFIPRMADTFVSSLFTKLVNLQTKQGTNFITPDEVPTPNKSGSYYRYLLDVAKLAGKAMTNKQARLLLLTTLNAYSGLAQEGVILTWLRELLEKDNDTKALVNIHAGRMKIEQTAKAMEALVYQILLENFETLTKEDTRAIYEVYLKGDVQCLTNKMYKNGYTTDQIIELLQDKTKLDSALQAQLNIIRNHEKVKRNSSNFDAIDKFITVLANYMHTRTSVLGQKYNARNIAKYVTNSTDEELVAAIDRATTLLYLSQFAKKELKSIASSLKKEGIDTFLDLHGTHVKQSYSQVDHSFFVRSGHIIKGYFHPVYDDSGQITIAGTDETTQKRLAKKDYFLVKNLSPKGLAGNNGLKLGIYKRSYTTINRITGGAFSMAGTTDALWSLTPDTLEELKNSKLDDDEYEELFKKFVKLAKQSATQFFDSRITKEALLKQAGDFITLGSEDGSSIDNFTYSINEEASISLLGQSTDGLVLLANMFGNSSRKVDSSVHNKVLIDFLKKDFALNGRQKGIDPRTGEITYRHVINNTRANAIKYVQITNQKYLPNGELNPNYDPYIGKIWDKLPISLKAAAKEEAIFIRDDWKLDLFGIESISLADTKLLSYTNTTVRYSVTILEQIMKSLTHIAKQAIVFKKPIVLLLNILSNIALSTTTYGDPTKIIRYQLRAVRNTYDYLLKQERLERLKLARLRTGGILSQEHDSEENALRLALQRNPVHMLMEAGLFSGVTKDLEGMNRRDTAWLRKKIKEKLFNNRDFDEATLPKHMKAVFDQIYMNKGTFFFELMYVATQYSDFIARAAEFELACENPVNKHGGKITKYKEGNQKHGDTDEFLAYKRRLIDELRDRFVNYDLPVSQLEQYLNDFGLIWFAKYRKRIQHILMNTIKEHPITALGLYALSMNMLSIETPIAGLIALSGFTFIRNPLRMIAQGFIPPIANLM